MENKRQILLSLVVSCRGFTAILEKNLSALRKQDLDKKLWKPLFLFKEGQKHSDCVFLIKDYFPSYTLLFLPENEPLYEMRNLALQNISCPYIYFIDEDVILEDSQHLSRLLKLHKENSEVTVIGGGYLDHPDCTFWGRSYNWLTRLWIENHKNFVPAGNLSIKTGKSFKARFYSPNPFGFGGEEVYFLRSLESEGHSSICKKELSAKHLALHGLKAFIKRAWIHGASLEEKREKSDYSLFFKERASFLTKTAALFYLLLVRFSCFFYKRA